MGFWNMLKNINNAEGIRETMRISYDRAFKRAMKESIEILQDRKSKMPLHGSTPNELAVIDAMTSRYWSLGIPINPIIEMVIWSDVLPFLYFEPATAREALAEYAVYKAMPKDAKISWLETLVKQGCENGLEKDKEMYTVVKEAAKDNRVAWLLLLEGRGNDYFW
jgi:hypothetical protein